MKQAFFVTALVIVVGFVWYFHYRYAIQGIPLSKPIEEQAWAINLTAKEVEAAIVVASKYSLSQKTALGIAAELRVVRSNRNTIEREYIADLCRRRGITEDVAGAFIIDYKLYLALGFKNN